MCCQCLTVCSVCSALADTSADDAAAHATGNGVASEVGRPYVTLYALFALVFVFPSTSLSLLVSVLLNIGGFVHPF